MFFKQNDLQTNQSYVPINKLKTNSAYRFRVTAVSNTFTVTSTSSIIQTRGMYYVTVTHMSSKYILHVVCITSQNFTSTSLIMQIAHVMYYATATFYVTINCESIKMYSVVIVLLMITRIFASIII